MQFKSDGQVAMEKFDDCQSVAAEIGQLLIERAEGRDIPVEMLTAITIMVAARTMVATVIAHGASLRPRDLRPLVRDYGKFLEVMCMDTAANTRNLTTPAGNA